MKFGIRLACFIFIYCLSICTGGYGQNYRPIKSDSPARLKEEAKKIDLRYAAFTKEIKRLYKGKLGAFMADELNKGKDFLREDVLGGQFVFDHEVYGFVYGMFEKICHSNGIQPGHYNLLVRRSPELNAACYPDGTFVVNIGLFYYLANEDEFAAVLAHEMAHKLLQHWERRTEYRYSRENDPAYMAELKEIQLQKSGRYDRAFDVFKSTLYSNMNVRRSHEYEADSLGYLILGKSPYRGEASYQALDFMVQADSFEFRQLMTETFRSIFQTPDLAFRDSWLTIEDLSAYDYTLSKEKLSKDSLSSHPETRERRDQLVRSFPEISTSEARVNGSEQYAKFVAMSKLEVVPSLFHQKNFGSALHAALMMIEDNEEQEYHKAWVGKCLKELYQARREFTFSKYITQVNPKEQSAALQQFLSFMWNLGSTELQTLANYYELTYPLIIE
jgi:Zn-dependent protease with chaperone function